jgi:hypothetical protein
MLVLRKTLPRPAGASVLFHRMPEQVRTKLLLDMGVKRGNAARKVPLS